MVATGGIDFAHGRESSQEFNESLAGVNLMDDPNESFDKQKLVVNAYVGCTPWVAQSSSVVTVVVNA